jgi:superfamily I DNA/RNA helicase
MNSVGHRVWGAAVGKRLIVETKKNYNLVREHIDNLPRHQKSDAYDLFGDITKALSRAKLSGYVARGVTMGRALISADDFFGSFEEAPDDWFIELVDKCLGKSIVQAYAGLIDFDDQIYMPTLFGGSFPQFKRVLGDEAQDFSKLNQAMIEKLVGPATWLAAVGDPYQSIYAFRGADTASMSWLQERFDMHEMGLSVSFRCPVTVVENAHWRVPHMKYPAWAKQGVVKTLEKWSHADIPDDAAIICRNNAPLMACALRLLREGRGVRLMGTDLGPQLVKLLKKMGESDTPRADVMARISAWEREKLSRAQDAGSISDKAECLRVFAGFGLTLGAAIDFCERTFRSAGTIQLMSGHKAKGLEFDTCFHLDPHRIPSPWSKEGEALEQERNVKYVIETRSREALFFIRLDGYEEENT